MLQTINIKNFYNRINKIVGCIEEAENKLLECKHANFQKCLQSIEEMKKITVELLRLLNKIENAETKTYELLEEKFFIPIEFRLEFLNKNYQDIVSLLENM